MIIVQEVPAFRDFRIRDPRYFVIWFWALISCNPRHFVISKTNKKNNYENFTKMQFFFCQFLVVTFYFLLRNLHYELIMYLT